jgi:putative PEP-CTERM system histidine kinase
MANAATSCSNAGRSLSHEKGTLPGWLASFGRRALAVPLVVGGEMLGLAVLRDPRPGLALDYEDIDLLRIAGGQAMTALAQDEAHRQLTESRQFEAYNRLTAFLMHDLKNLIAQQSLVVRNAGRFRSDPAFIDDAIDTIDNSVQRMQRLLEQLRQGSERERRESVSLARLLESVVASHADGAPAPVLRVAAPAVKVDADPDRLGMIVGHVIRNAQDATPADGSITVTLDEADGFARVVVADTGTGMDVGFVAERLFRPFDSTKGAKGMGIGAYQVRQFAEEAGGGATVQSAPGKGTRFEIRLPLAAVTRPPAEAVPAAAPREDALTEKEQPASG